LARSLGARGEQEKESSIVTKDELDLYLEEVNRHFVEKEQERQKSERIAWRVAGAAGVIAAMAVAAVMGLTPLKQTKSDVIFMDKTAGTWDQPMSLEKAQITLDESFKNHFLTLFWTSCESYSYDQAELNYYTCAAFLSPELQSQLAQEWDQGNPKNPMTVYGKRTSWNADIRSISLEKKEDGTEDVARIRYTKSNAPGKFWIAKVTFKLVEPPKDERYKRINPVGFQVTERNVVPETADVRSGSGAR
jgi:type IV secretion system protein VirB8